MTADQPPSPALSCLCDCFVTAGSARWIGTHRPSPAVAAIAAAR